MLLVISGAAVGGVATVLAGSEPGIVLGVFLIAATVAAGLAVRPEAARLIIPVPALAYFVVAVVAGLIHDRAADTSHTALVISAAQSVASGFPAMTVATLLAIAITAARWWQGSRHPHRSERPPPAARPSAGRAPAPRRPVGAGQRPPRG